MEAFGSKENLNELGMKPKKIIRRIFIAPDVLLRYFTIGDPHIEIVLEKTEIGDVELVISDFVLYEAIASMEEKELNHERLKKFLLHSKIVYCPIKLRMKHSRKMQLRKLAGL